MVDPYRTLAVRERIEAPRDPGVVGDIIAQFADPNAFLRELVQNAIDAGSPDVAIAVEHDAEAGVVRIAVRDRGQGMSRDTIENQLLVLFRSTKEGDRSKIGKFGIGFASVLAPSPEVVVIDTVHGGQHLTVHLQRDLTYELFDTGHASHDGTTVTLELAMAADAVDGFARACEATLVRWCRHASVPIELEVALPDALPTRTRIDRPIEIDGALVTVRGTGEDRELTAIVALTAEPAPYTGFFNHGLTLYETSANLIGKLSAKLQDSRLGHTISRDNVRRDEAYARALEAARWLATHELPAATGRALHAAAEADDLPRYRALLHALCAAELPLPPGDWPVPLVEPLPGPNGDRRTLALGELGRRAWTAERSGPLTRSLASAGTAVVHASAADRELIAAHIRDHGACELVDAASELTYVAPLPPTDNDHALLGVMRELFAAIGREPPAIAIALCEGALADQLALGGNVGDQPYVLDRDQAARSPFARLRAAPLVLVHDHPAVRAARAGDPRIAAAHLARLVLLRYGLLDRARSATLLEHTLDGLGIRT